ncbi:MAG: hypothetical protein ACHQ4F_08680 [Candidatus Dormibacteria bacterium]
MDGNNADAKRREELGAADRGAGLPGEVGDVTTCASNAAKGCPYGCAGAALITRARCRSWTRESVTDSAGLVATVALSGGNCPATNYYVFVIMENDRPVADDISCGQEAVAFGMYNNSANANGALSCSYP